MLSNPRDRRKPFGGAEERGWIRMGGRDGDGDDEDLIFIALVFVLCIRTSKETKTYSEALLAAN
jgi:hypothetical protein